MVYKGQVSDFAVFLLFSVTSISCICSQSFIAIFSVIISSCYGFDPSQCIPVDHPSLHDRTSPSCTFSTAKAETHMFLAHAANLKHSVVWAHGHKQAKLKDEIEKMKFGEAKNIVLPCGSPTKTQKQLLD